MNANGRRYRQAKMLFANLTPRQRPNYKTMEAAASAAHQARVVATEHRIRQGSKKGK